MAQRKPFPSQIKYIIGTELCERFGYFGVTGILVIYFVKYLAVPEHEAKAIFHYFTSAAYFCTLIGGYLADRFLGKYRTIMYIALIYCLGPVLIAAWPSKAGVYLGLAVIALGMGGIKSCVSAFVGDQFTEENKSLVKDVFHIFYWAINVGAIGAALLTPWVLGRFGPSWAFSIPGFLMATATFIFWLGHKQYVNVPPAQETGSAGFGPVFWHALTHWSQRRPGQSFFDTALARFPAEDVEGAKAATNVFKVFISVSMYWALFFQGGSSWILQADRMNLNVLGIQFYAAQIRFLNPIFVLLLIPIYSYFIYPALERIGIKMTPLRRMSGGMFLSSLSFVAVGVIQRYLDSGHKLSVAWQAIPFLIITMAEVMISITGLEFAYSQAPRSMKGTLMSFWFMTTVLGNLLTAYVAELNIFQGASYFFFFAGLMVVVSTFFSIVAARYRPREFFEKGQPSGAPVHEDAEAPASGEIQPAVVPSLSGKAGSDTRS